MKYTFFISLILLSIIACKDEDISPITIAEQLAKIEGVYIGERTMERLENTTIYDSVGNIIDVISAWDTAYFSPDTLVIEINPSDSSFNVLSGCEEHTFIWNSENLYAFSLNLDYYNRSIDLNFLQDNNRVEIHSVLETGGQSAPPEITDCVFIGNK